MDENTTDDLVELQQQLRISSHSIADAMDVWRKRRSALLDGWYGQTQGDNAADYSRDIKGLVAHRDRYLSIARYCDEARELLSRYRGASDSDDVAQARQGDKIFLIDPHVMRAYCEFWDPAAHKGFEFLEGELEANERMDYQLFIYSSLLNGTELGLPNAARPDLSKAIAFFVEDHRHRDGSTRKDRAIYKELENALVASKFEQDTSKQLDFIHRKATSLATSVAGVAEQQSLALARINRLLTKGRFFVPEAMIQSRFREEPEKVQRFSRIVQKFRTDPSRLNDSHLDLSSAYKAFDDLTRLANIAHDAGQAHRPIRGGEQIDLDIVQEVHLLNTALKMSELDCEFVYITLSSRIYSFLSAFNQQDILCPIIHPRTALVYRENKLAKDQRVALETALSSPIAFGRGIPKDKFIRPNELRDFEDAMGTILKVTRETFSYSAVTQYDGLGHFFEAFKSIFEKSADEELSAKGLDLIGDMQAKFERVAETVGDAYSSAISYDLSEKTWEAYQNFSAGLNALDHQLVSIREYRVDGGNAGSRYTVVPLTRGFRHMFVLHNAFLADALHQVVGSETKQMAMGDLLKIVRDSTHQALKGRTKDSEEAAKAEATKFFVRACYAACNGEWNLVHSMTINGCEKLESFRSFPRDSELSQSTARAVLIGQELNFMRHLAERALAESSASAGLHGSRLLRAAGALYESSEVTVGLPKRFAHYATPYSPMSVREGLAAIGLLLEWWLKDSWRQLTSRDHKLPPLLRASNDPEIVWSDMDWLSHPIAREDLKDPQLMISAAESILVKAQACLDTVLEEPGNGHSAEMWRYLVLRAYAMAIMASQVGGVLSGVGYEGAEKSRISEMLKLRREHYAQFVPSEIKLPKDVDYLDHNPFTDGLLGIERFLKATHREGIGKRVIVDLPEALRAFADIDQNCSELYRFGFPRMYLRRAKELLIGPIFANLRSTYMPREKNL